MRGSLAGYVPDVSVPIVDRPDASVAEQFDALHDHSGADAAADFAYVAERSRGWAAAAEADRPGFAADLALAHPDQPPALTPP